MSSPAFIKRFTPGAIRLAALCGFASGLSIARFAYSGRRTFLFLIWNLGLAAIPYLISRSLSGGRKSGRPRSAVLFAAWLIFFPNAPYLLTDFIHLFRERSAPLWYDLILLSSYAMAGLFLACESLAAIERWLPPGVLSKKWLLPGYLYLAAFGVYLGRFLRWNSWDLLVAPHLVIIDSVKVLTGPETAPGAWAFSLSLGTLLNLLFLWFKPPAGGRARMDAEVPGEQAGQSKSIEWRSRR